MLEWLRRQKQTPAAIDRFWRVVLVSALNEDLDRTDANYGVLVFWKAFLSNPAAFGMGVPAVPLADLYATCSERIEKNGGDVRTRCSVAEVCVSSDGVVCVRLEGSGEVCGDYYILAVPFDRLPKLLPAEVSGTAAFANLSNLCVSPITGVHMWFDQPVMSEPFLTTVDHTIQWIFNRTGQYVQIVISASRALSDRTQQEIVEICRRELDDVLPAAGKARLLRAVVIRESAATFSPAPGCDRASRAWAGCARGSGSSSPGTRSRRRP